MAGRLGKVVAALVVCCVALGAQKQLAHAEPRTGLDCFSEDMSRRIAGCTSLLQMPGLSNDDRAQAHASRALAYSLRAEYGQAIPDYDQALSLKPDFPVALNNRAWALFKSGRAAEGLPDVESSLALEPTNPHALDTRAHIRQALGQPEGALRDYIGAMTFGGKRMIRLYQCGLREQGLYTGNTDGIYTSALKTALEACVTKTSCDPLPADEQCREPIS